MRKVVLVTGGFDPIHSGHIEYLNGARRLGDMLVVGVNSDAWLERKKGCAFMPSNDRITIIQNLKMVNHCILFNDDDGTALEAIKNVKLLYPTDHIIFANGGDRDNIDTLPERSARDVEFIFGVGGLKTRSSSELLANWTKHNTDK
jgi:cytidyltransferase-like protein